MAAEKEFDPNLEYSLMSAHEKIGVLLSTLGVNTTQMIFSHLKDNDVKKLITIMSNVSRVPIAIVKKVLQDFYSGLNEDSALLFSGNRGKDFILNTLGEERAKQLLGQIMDLDHHNMLEALDMVDSRTLANFLINEHPQTIALIIAHLPIDRKVDTLKRLPDNLQVEVVLRIANLDYVSPDLISQLDDVLKNELSTMGFADVNQLGGVEPIADLLNLMDKNSEKKIMQHIEDKDPELAEEIKKRMFVFEDLIYIDDLGIQNLIKIVDSKTMVVALKTAPSEIRDKLYKNMSTRAATLMQEDLESLGPTKLSDVEAAQAEIVQKCKDLEAQGKAFVSRGGEGDTFV
jgi:flagellar motor switch protein FliG